MFLLVAEINWPASRVTGRVLFLDAVELGQEVKARQALAIMLSEMIIHCGVERARGTRQFQPQPHCLLLVWIPDQVHFLASLPLDSPSMTRGCIEPVNF